MPIGVRLHIWTDVCQGRFGACADSANSVCLCSPGVTARPVPVNRQANGFCGVRASADGESGNEGPNTRTIPAMQTAIGGKTVAAAYNLATALRLRGPRVLSNRFSFSRAHHPGEIAAGAPASGAKAAPPRSRRPGSSRSPARRTTSNRPSPPSA